MPLYEISHCVGLSDAQQDKIATTITKIHTELFGAPSLFVNVRFTPASTYVGFVGGKRTVVNSIIGNVRHGPSRTPEMYAELTTALSNLWAEVVSDSPDIRIFILGGIVAGLEHGVTLPPAGGDKEWLRKNLPIFQKKADAGNQEMKDLIEEVKARKMID